MRVRTVARVVGILVAFVGAAMLVPAVVALVCSEEDLFAHLVAAGITMAAGGAVSLAAGRRERLDIMHREAFAIVAFGWIASCVAGGLPFFLFARLPPLFNADAPARVDREEPGEGTTDSPPDCERGAGIGREFCSFTNCVFESTSGFTTTGATILESGLWKNPEGRRGGLPRGILLWRALTQFMGGMGIILMAVAVLPLLGVGGMQLFKAEVPGPVKDKMAPRVAETARLLWKVYFGVAGAEFVLLLFTQGPFLAACHTLSTMATGGFSPLAKSIEGLDSPLAEWIVALFMFVAGANFTLHLTALRRRRPIHLLDEEFRFYAVVVLCFGAAIGGYLIVASGFGAHDGLRAGIFQTVSILTTTGFSTRDFALWGVGAQGLLFFLYFVGGCAGSTGGGPKCVRVWLMIRLAWQEMKRLIHPRAVIQTKISGHVVEQDVIHSAAGMVMIYLGVFAVSAMVLSLCGHDIVTSLTAVAACIGNVGPGLGPVGPAGNYNFLAAPLKWLLDFDMIAGRLELYSIIVLLTPEFWRR